MQKRRRSVPRGWPEKKTKLHSEALGQLQIFPMDILQAIAQCLPLQDLINFLRRTSKHLHHVRVLQLDYVQINIFDENQSFNSLLNIYQSVLYLDVFFQHLEISCLDPRALQSLKSLDLSCNPLVDSDFSHFMPINNLVVLDLHATRITDESLTNIATLRQLQSLNLKKTWITDEGLGSLIECKRLEKLSLPEQISDAGLVHVGRITSLLVLNFWKNLLTSTGLSHLASLLSLQTLRLSYCRLLDDQGLSELRQMSHLQVLNIVGCAFSDRALALFLIAHPAIEWLNRGNRQSLLSRPAIDAFIASQRLI